MSHFISDETGSERIIDFPKTPNSAHGSGSGFSFGQ